MVMLKLHRVMVYVSDMTRAVAFYRDKIGMTPGVVTDQYSELANSRISIALHASTVAADVRRSQEAPTLVFVTEDVDEAAAYLKEKGVEFSTAPFWVTTQSRLAEFFDSEGNKLSVVSV